MIKASQRMIGRQRIAADFGPGYLCGITLGAWFRLLAANRFAVDLRCWPRAASITAASVVNSLLAAFEGKRYRVAASGWPVVAEPLFILGHWRSGTSHLHHLLAADERFVAPTLFQVIYPQTFLSTQGWLPRLLAPLVTPTRKIDNMPLALDGPAEDEWALCTLFGKSPYLSVTFPRSEEVYDQYLALRGASDNEQRRWRATLRAFVSKVSGGSGRIPLLKSPPHTCRIKLLLEEFPGARFVHIHRRPFEVFQSMRNLLAGWHERHHLQRRDLAHLDDRIIRQYKEMYDVFLDERSLIPAGRLHELAFDALQREPVRELRQLYECLSLPEFSEAEPAVRRRLESVAGYEKNHYLPLSGPIRARLANEWARTFNEWGYSAA